ncbi:MAG TPA: hypothetical protein PKY64_01840 [Anaerolineaceae bacterium]|nr:hypothetical protein [Anaerolineaceae bacterium]
MSEESNLRESIDKAHKRNRFWMILFPVILVSLVLLGLTIWIAIKNGIGGADTATLAVIATVLLVLPALLLGLLFLWLMIKMSNSLTKLQESIPRAGKSIRDYISMGKHYLRGAADASAEPILALRGLSAKIQQIGTSLTDRFSQKG